MSYSDDVANNLHLVSHDAFNAPEFDKSTGSEDRAWKSTLRKTSHRKMRARWKDEPPHFRMIWRSSYSISLQGPLFCFEAFENIGAQPLS